MIQTATAGLMQRQGVRQFVKFCIIGFTSMFIDVGISYQLIYSLGMNATLAKTISFAVAVTNGPPCAGNNAPAARPAASDPKTSQWR